MIRLKIKEVATDRGVSEAERSAGLHASTVKRLYHNAFAETDTDILGKLADALNVDVSRLIESVQDEQTAS